MLKQAATLLKKQDLQVYFGSTFKCVWTKKATSENGFSSTGIAPRNQNIAEDHESLPSSVYSSTAGNQKLEQTSHGYTKLRSQLISVHQQDFMEYYLLYNE
jgi:hypothetical protein